MQLVDVNILIYAHRPEYDRHEAFRDWLLELVRGDGAYGMSDVAVSGFVRIVTHHRIHAVPSPLADALDFARRLLAQPQCVRVTPGPAHWKIFDRLCRTVDAAGNLITDAYYAALAIESGSEWITADRGFGRFPGLRWRHPLDG